MRMGWSCTEWVIMRGHPAQSRCVSAANMQDGQMPTDSEIQAMIDSAGPGLNDVLDAYERVEREYMVAAATTSLQQTVVASANTSRR